MQYGPQGTASNHGGAKRLAGPLERRRGRIFRAFFVVAFLLWWQIPAELLPANKRNHNRREQRRHQKKERDN